MSSEFLLACLVAAAPYALAGLGALATELAGVLNIGLESLMLLGAFAAICASHAGMSAPVSLLVALGICALMASVMAGLRWIFKADIFLLGLGFNLLIPGLIGMLSPALGGSKAVITLDSGYLGAEFSWGLLLAALSLGLTFQGFVTKTRWGMRLSSVSAWPDMLKARGIEITPYQTGALIFSGLMAGLAGAGIALSLGSWVPNMSAGKGWIALVLVYAGGRSPLGVLGVSLAYAGSELASLRYQGMFALPQLSLALPYLLLLVILALVKTAGLVRGRGVKASWPA